MALTTRLLSTLFGKDLGYEPLPGCSPRGGFRVPRFWWNTICADDGGDDPVRVLTWHKGSDHLPHEECVPNRTFFGRRESPSQYWVLAFGPSGALVAANIPAWWTSVCLTVPKSVQQLRAPWNKPTEIFHHKNKQLEYRPSSDVVTQKPEEPASSAGEFTFDLPKNDLVDTLGPTKQNGVGALFFVVVTAVLIIFFIKSRPVIRPVHSPRNWKRKD